MDMPPWQISSSYLEACKLRSNLPARADRRESRSVLGPEAG